MTPVEELQIWVASYKFIYVIQLGSEDKSDRPTLTVIDDWLAHTNRIRSIVWVDKQVWSCSSDGICIWNLESNTEEFGITRSYSVEIYLR